MQDLGFSAKRILSILSLTGVTLWSIVLLMNRSDLLPDLLIGLITNYAYCLLLHVQYTRSKNLPPQQAVSYVKKSWISRCCLILVGTSLVFHDPGAGMIAFLAGALLPYRVVLLFQSIKLLQKELQEAARSASGYYGNYQYGTSIQHPLLHSRALAWKRSWYDSILKRPLSGRR